MDLKSSLTGRYEYRAPLTGLKEIYQMDKINCHQGKAQKHGYYFLYPFPCKKKKIPTHIKRYYFKTSVTDYTRFKNEMKSGIPLSKFKSKNTSYKNNYSP